MTITTVAPTISDAGFSAPSLADILDFLQTGYRGIYESDVYLGSDSQDGQFLSIIAQAIFNVNSVSAQVYRSFSPATAIGDALSSNVKINGIARDVASFSTVDLTLTGQAGTTITNGVVTDIAKNRWSLPATVTIPSGGTITVTATCQTLGAVTAATNTVNQIATPTLGWQAATNPTAASPGVPVENDAALRSRQAVSTALPSQSILDGIVGAIATLPNVTRYAAFENPTGTTDANGIPAHSISLVVEGGDVAAIAQQIALKKTPGTGTYGTTSQVVTDQYGGAITINFYRPTNQAITAAITLKALPGYSSDIGAAIQQAVADYVNSVPIGGGEAAAVEWDQCITAAKSISQAGTVKISSFVISGPGGAGTPDVPLTFNQAATCVPSAIVLTVT